MDDGLLRVSRTCMIPVAELHWRFTGPGGPGGQHANTSNTKVEVRFSIETSPSLGPRQRERLLARLGPVVKVTASDRRSQSMNRQLALERLRTKLAEGLSVDRRRVATVPTRSSTKRRVDQKKHRSQIKRLRQRPVED